jgi:hypothetical protein
MRTLIAAKLLAPTIAERPKSPLQRYVTTEAGKKWLAERRSKR